MTIAILIIRLCYSDAFPTHPCKNAIVVELKLCFSIFSSPLEGLSLVCSPLKVGYISLQLAEDLHYLCFFTASGSGLASDGVCLMM